MSKSRQPKGKDHNNHRNLYLCAGYCRKANGNQHFPSDIVNLTKSFCNMGKDILFDLRGGALKDFLKKKYSQKKKSFRLQLGDVIIRGAFNVYPDGKYQDFGDGCVLLETRYFISCIICSFNLHFGCNIYFKTE